MSEFEIGGQNYRIGKLTPFQQFHVVRRLAPVLSGMAMVKEEGDVTFSQLLVPIANAIAKMSDEDCDFILFTCLGVVQRQQQTAWAGVYRTGTQVLMFDDIDLTSMMQIAVKVIQENLGSFFSAGVANLTETTPPAA